MTISQSESNRRYGQSEKGRAARRRANEAYRARNRQTINAMNRKPCVVCGGPKEPGGGFTKCNACWGVRAQKELDALIQEQANEMASGSYQPPQHFGDSHLPRGRVVEIGPNDDSDEWDDPVADEALNSLPENLGTITCHGGC